MWIKLSFSTLKIFHEMSWWRFAFNRDQFLCTQCTHLSPPAQVTVNDCSPRNPSSALAIAQHVSNFLWCKSFKWFKSAPWHQVTITNFVCKVIACIFLPGWMPTFAPHAPVCTYVEILNCTICLRTSTKLNKIALYDFIDQHFLSFLNARMEGWVIAKGEESNLHPASIINFLL